MSLSPFRRKTSWGGYSQGDACLRALDILTLFLVFGKSIRKEVTWSEIRFSKTNCKPNLHQEGIWRMNPSFFFSPDSSGPHKNTLPWLGVTDTLHKTAAASSLMISALAVEGRALWTCAQILENKNFTWGPACLSWIA